MLFVNYDKYVAGNMFFVISVSTVFSSICPTFPLRAKQNVLAHVSHALSQGIFDV
jgi:hypothetical protein